MIRPHAITPNPETAGDNAFQKNPNDESAALALHARAKAALDPTQRAEIERPAKIVRIDVPTIELAGDSVRCMIAGVHLSSRPDTTVPGAAK